MRTFNNQEWKREQANTLRATGGATAPMSVTGIAWYSQYSHPWLLPDKPMTLRLDGTIAPGLTHLADRTSELRAEASWRIRAAWRALRHGYDDDEDW